MEEMMMQYMAKLDLKVEQVMQSNQSSIHNLEVQVGQLAKMVTDRGQGKFPNNTEVNPKEGAMAITLRSGKNIENLRRTSSEEQSPKKIEEETDKRAEEEVLEESKEAEQPLVQPYVPPIPYPQRLKRRTQGNNFQKFLDIFKKL